MQNAEEWNLDFYLMDLADEIARHTFNTGRYPEINYITGNAGPDTPTTTNQDGVLNVYVPQGIDTQQFQQALNEYIKNGCDLGYQQSQCRIQVVQCQYEEEEAQKRIQAFNAARDTEYYRLINGPNNSLYIMKCEAQTPEIKKQIQQQFENSNGYYYSQTNTYTPNSYESNSKESKYITALKMFYLTNIMPQRLPQPDQDDEEQQKLYAVCQYLPHSQQHDYEMFCGMMQGMLDNEQTDLNNEVKNCGISLTDPATIQQYTLQYQSVVPEINSIVPVQEQPVITNQGYNPAVIPEPVSYPTSVEFLQPPVPVKVPVETNPYNPAVSVTTPEQANYLDPFQGGADLDANNINLQQEEQFEDFGTIQIKQISGNSAVNAKLKVTCKNKNGKELCFDVNNVTNVLLKDVINVWTNTLDIPNGDSDSWQFNDSKTFLSINALIFNLKNRTINVKRKKRLAEIGNNINSQNNMNNVNNNNNDNIDLGIDFNKTMGFQNIIYNNKNMAMNNNVSTYNPNVVEQNEITDYT